MTEFIPRIKNGRVNNWVSKKDAHYKDPVLHDANTCLVVNDDMVLLSRRPTGERDSVSPKRVGSGQWEGVSTHVHKDDVKRYGINSRDIDSVNENIKALNMISAVERVEHELDVSICPGLQDRIGNGSFSDVIDGLRSNVNIEYIGMFQYSMDRQVDGDWSEMELCRCFVIRSDLTPSRTDEVMDFRWEPISDLSSEDMESSDEYATWTSKGFEKVENQLDVS